MKQNIVDQLKLADNVDCGSSRGIISIITENYIRIDWKGKPHRYDVLNKKSPIWDKLGAPE